MRVSPEEIRNTAKIISSSADHWLEAVSNMQDAPASAFGSDDIGSMLSSFHQRTHQPSVEYFHEVGHCAHSVGAALDITGRLYADTEMDNAARAEQVQTLVDAVGRF